MPSIKQEGCDCKLITTHLTTSNKQANVERSNTKSRSKGADIRTLLLWKQRCAMCEDSLHQLIIYAHIDHVLYAVFQHNHK